MITTSIKDFFDNAILDKQFSINKIDNDALKQLTKKVCNRPEFKPFLSGITIEFNDVASEQPFRVSGANHLSLNSSILYTSAILAFRLRHSLELITLRRLFAIDDSTQEDYLVWSILGFHTSLSYFGQMLTKEKVSIQQTATQWEAKALEYVISGKLFSCPAEKTCAFIADFFEYLLPLQGIEIDHTSLSSLAIKNACKIATPLLKLAHPTERLLTFGGDNRLAISSETGLNQYGCSPCPRPWAVTFSSCTASSVSYHAFKQTEALRQSLLTQAFRQDFSTCFIEAMENVRLQLAEVLKIHTLDTELIFTSSGTDGEFLALFFALGDQQKNCLNILIAPTEVGSGSLPAAAGLHFNATTPSGTKVQPGTALEGFPVEKVRIECLPVRQDSGAIFAITEIDSAMNQMVEQAIENNEVVLIHLLDCSKTGLMAPSVAAVSRLKSKYPDKVSVLVDAAQMRLSRNTLNQYLELGFMILITGSKFFRGPPFSGALLLPNQLSNKIQKQTCLNFPKGLIPYFSNHYFSPKLRSLAECLSDDLNIGLLMRWQSALWEMSAFFNVPSKQRYHIIKAFSHAALEAIDQFPELELVNSPIRERNITTANSWDLIPTVFTYIIYKKKINDDHPQAFTYEECRVIYNLLNRDIAHLLPEEATALERKVAFYQCHTGQPVKVKQINEKWIGGLRIASGARLVSGVYFDPMLGKMPEDRLKSQIDDMNVIMDKLSIIIKFWTNLNNKKS